MVTLEDLASRLDSLEHRLRGNPNLACTPEAPHNELTFMRGPNRYVCGRCGNSYVKAPHGVLRNE